MGQPPKKPVKILGNGNINFLLNCDLCKRVKILSPDEAKKVNLLNSVQANISNLNDQSSPFKLSSILSLKHR